MFPFGKHRVACKRSTARRPRSDQPRDNRYMTSDLSGSPWARLSRRSVLAAGLIGASAALGACSGPVQPGKTPSRERSWGAFIPVVAARGGAGQTPIARLSSLAGAQPDYLHVYASLRDSLPVETLDIIRQNGATPMLTLEPWRPGIGPDQPEYSLASIVEGRHDIDLARWADQLGSWGHAIFVRFAQEMNGTWYPWSIGVNQNTASEYRAAWSRMHAIVHEKARNVRFVWAPNAVTEGTSDFVDCYPESGTVDYLGVDGYNWGASPGHSWQSAEKLFARSIATLERLNDRLPILVTEAGCADGDTPEHKAQWIKDFFAVMENSQRVEGFLWFQTDKERDWRFNSTVASAEAFRGSLRGWIGGT